MLNKPLRIWRQLKRTWRPMIRIKTCPGGSLASDIESTRPSLPYRSPRALTKAEHSYKHEQFAFRPNL
jgi:hypothetical protein